MKPNSLKDPFLRFLPIPVGGKVVYDALAFSDPRVCHLPPWRFVKSARVVLQNCPALRSIPDILSGGHMDSIKIRNCPSLAGLPALNASDTIQLARLSLTTLTEPLNAQRLHVRKCKTLLTIEGTLKVRTFTIRKCPRLTTIPVSEMPLDLLELRGCQALAALPPGLSFAGSPARLRLMECTA